MAHIHVWEVESFQAFRGVTTVIEFDDPATATRFTESDAYVAPATSKIRADTSLLRVEGV